MGLKFRKSIKIAPGVKLNLNKKSASVSFGGKGIRHTVSSTGKRTSTVGIPGTGLSYSTSSGGTNTSPSRKTNKAISADVKSVNNNSTVKGEKPKMKKGCGTFLIVLLIIGMLGSCFESEETLESITLSTKQTESCDINTNVEIIAETVPEDYELSDDNFDYSDCELKVDGSKVTFSASEPGTYKIVAKDGDIKSNSIEITVVDKAAEEKAKKQAEEEAKKKAEEEAKKKAEEEKKKAEEEAKKKAEAEAKKKAEKENKKEQQSQQKPQNNNSNSEQTKQSYVLNTNTKKFHYPSCHSVDKIKKENYDTFKGSRDDLISQEYEACGNCNP